MEDLNKQWMATGKTGCTFAALFAKQPELVGWKTVINPNILEIPKDCLILSLQFPGKNMQYVKDWALQNGFYLVQIEGVNTGLRYNIGNNVCWVQYFGLESHVPTRQTPIPELMMCVKLPKKQYFKVGFNGVLHLAHASIEFLTAKKADKAWATSFEKTKKILGHSPNISEAAKTTFA